MEYRSQKLLLHVYESGLVVSKEKIFFKLTEDDECQMMAMNIELTLVS